MTLSLSGVELMNSNRKLTPVVIQVATVIIFALVSAAIPEYTWIFFILYFVVLTVIMMRTAGKGMRKVAEVKGSPLFKEENAASIMASDAALFKEIREQFKLAFLPMVSLVVIIFIYPVYWQYLDPLVRDALHSITDNAFITRFVEFLAFYAFLIAVMSLPRMLITRRSQQKKQLYIPRTFSVYRDGIYLEGRMIEYSKDACYKVDSKRRFVEIHSPKVPFVIRLYTLEVSKLADRLKEVGLYECRV